MTTFGDNDRLAAMVTNLIRAPLLVLLSDVDGLYDGDPAASRLEADPHRRAARRVDLRPGARRGRPGVSKGGMASKLEAARHRHRGRRERDHRQRPRRRATLAADRRRRRRSARCFSPRGRRSPSCKRWIGFTAQPRGALVLDAGAREAVEKQGQQPAGHRRASKRPAAISQGRRRGAARRGGRRVRPRADELLAPTTCCGSRG